LHSLWGCFVLLTKAPLQVEGLLGNFGHFVFFLCVAARCTLSSTDNVIFRAWILFHQAYDSQTVALSTSTCEGTLHSIQYQQSDFLCRDPLPLGIQLSNTHTHTHTHTHTYTYTQTHTGDVLILKPHLDPAVMPHLDFAVSHTLILL